MKFQEAIDEILKQVKEHPLLGRLEWVRHVQSLDSILWGNSYDKKISCNFGMYENFLIMKLRSKGIINEKQCCCHETFSPAFKYNLDKGINISSMFDDCIKNYNDKIESWTIARNRLAGKL